MWPRRATDEALSAVNATLIAAKDALHAIAEVDLSALDEAYALCTPAEAISRVSYPLEHTIEDGEEKFSDNGHKDNRHLSYSDDGTATSRLSNPLGLFGEDHATEVGHVDNQPPPAAAAAKHSEVSVVHTGSVPESESWHADHGNGSNDVQIASHGNAPSKSQTLPALSHVASGSMPEPSSASPMPYSRAHSSPEPVRSTLSWPKHSFSASNACAPTDAALKKVLQIASAFI